MSAGFRAAVIGGVALTAYGNVRMTLDLDVVTDAAAQETVIRFLEGQRFVTLHRSPGYSNHRGHCDTTWRSDRYAYPGRTLQPLWSA